MTVVIFIKEEKMKNIGDLMRKAQRVQSEVNILQKKMDVTEFTGQAADGAVQITMTGRGEPKKVHLDASVVDANDVETLEDLILVALQDTRDKIDQTMADNMERIQSSLGLPKDFKLPF